MLLWELILNLTSLHWIFHLKIRTATGSPLTPQTGSSTLPPKQNFPFLSLPCFGVFPFHCLPPSFLDWQRKPLQLQSRIEGVGPSPFPFFFFFDFRYFSREVNLFHRQLMQFSLQWNIFSLSFYFISDKTSTFYLGEEDLIFALPKDPPLLLTERMKGLLKGLKYFSQMFDEKEPEMQIGLPTDVKHVAHIGMDGPSANKPSWMSGFNSAPELSSVPLNGAGNHDSLPPLGNEKQKKQRRKPSIGSGSPTGSPKGTEKQSRRQRSSNLSMGSPGRDSSCHGRRHKNSSRGSESSSQELPDIPKSSRRKKSKGSSGGSEGSTRSKRPNSLPDVMEIESSDGSFRGIE